MESLILSVPPNGAEQEVEIVEYVGWVARRDGLAGCLGRIVKALMEGKVDWILHVTDPDILVLYLCL
jgi:hypothetical protein